MDSRTAIFRSLVRDFVKPAAIVVPPGSACGDLALGMAAAKASMALVSSADGQPVGIVTEQDLARRAAYQVASEEPVERIMSAPVETISGDDRLYVAIACMRRRQWRHMPFTGPDGRVLGVLDLHGALIAGLARTAILIDKLAHEDSLDGLAAVKAAQVEVALSLFDEGAATPEIQALLSDVNLDIHRRALRLCEHALEAEGKGGPPVPYAFIVMGSGGRGENFLYPDQDNAFVIADHPDADWPRHDAYFLALAERVTAALDRAGFPLCKGNVMATNRIWRLRLADWTAQIDTWVRRRRNEEALLADIFFDFRRAAGDDGLAEALRAHVGHALAQHPGFLTNMYRIEAKHDVSLGFLGRLSTRRAEGEEAARIDLKMGGTLPLVEGARLYALKAGLRETSTLARLAGLEAKGVLSSDEHDALQAAFHHVTRVLLREQLSAYAEGRPVGNRVDPTALSERERDLLVDSLKAIRALRDRMRDDFGGGVF
jgi:signal-transduction protein with cAMP-binding, CBS, and nucleotidyltransferase domain